LCFSVVTLETGDRVVVEEGVMDVVVITLVVNAMCDVNDCSHIVVTLDSGDKVMAEEDSREVVVIPLVVGSRSDVNA